MIRGAWLQPVALFAWTAGIGCDASPPCGGFCGHGTVCVDRKCVPEPPEAPLDPQDEPKRSKTKRKRTKKGIAKKEAEAGAPDDPRFDDAHVPRYRPAKTIDMKAGSERLGDRQVRQSLSKLEPALNDCIAGAATRTEVEIGSGTVEFVIGVDPSGKVTGVTAKAPKSLHEGGLVKCLRRTVFGHRFPAYDGPAMGVDYSFDVR